MKSKTHLTDCKHGPLGDSIKDFFYDSLYQTQISRLERHKINVDDAVKILVNDYLKSVGNYRG